MNDRLPLFLAESTSEDSKVKRILIYHSENPQRLKKFNNSKLILVFYGSLTAKSESQE